MKMRWGSLPWYERNKIYEEKCDDCGHRRVDHYSRSKYGFRKRNMLVENIGTERCGSCQESGHLKGKAFPSKCMEFNSFQRFILKQREKVRENGGQDSVALSGDNGSGE